MKLTTTLECGARVCATFADDGQCTVKVFAQAEYAKGRTTTAEVPASPKASAAIALAMKAALEEVAPQLGPALQRAIAKSTEVAVQRGEL